MDVFTFKPDIILQNISIKFNIRFKKTGYFQNYLLNYTI